MNIPLVSTELCGTFVIIMFHFNGQVTQTSFRIIK